MAHGLLRTRSMTNTAAIRRILAGPIIGFLMMLAGCDNRPLDPKGDGSTTNCANVGCAAPPLCSAGCQATCGCCSCAPGERNGDLVCTSAGCYEPAPPSDGGSDAGSGVCALPFEVGPCDAAFQVYAYVDGACVQRTYGGCQGNANRFNTLEECLATCEGRPVPNGCPAGRIAQTICLECGPAGGCSRMAARCALPCSPDAAVPECSGGLTCAAGVCQVAYCI